MNKKKKSYVLRAELILKYLGYSKNKYAILGDLEEEFNDRLSSQGKFSAKIWYWKLVLISLPAFFCDSIYGSIVMFKNYLKISIRNIKRQKVYSLINISGLAIGFACFILIFLFIQYELSFDSYHKKADRIKKIIYKFTDASKMGSDLKMTVHPPCIPALLDAIPEIETGTRFTRYYNGPVEIGDKTFHEDKWIWADERIFDVFTIPFVYGSKENALTEPYSVVINHVTAIKYFGDVDPVGEKLKYSSFSREFRITGVIKDIPGNSHFKPDLIGSLETQRNRWPMESWDAHWFHSYIVLYEETDQDELEEKIRTFIDDHILRDASNKSWTYLLKPMEDIHLRSSNVLSTVEPVSDIKFVYISSVIALFIIIIACINFVNLSTSLSVKRSKEVMVRKVTGAQRYQLFRQFLSESAILTIISLVLAIFLSGFLLESFAKFVERDLSQEFIDTKVTIFVLIITAILISIASGYYPAFYLSGLDPNAVIKGKHSIKVKGVNFRNLLVVFQFTISVFLIFCTLIISGQVDFIKNADVGYNRENVVVFDTNSDILRNSSPFRNELLQIPGVSNITFSLTLPILINWDTDIDYEGRQEDESFNIYFCEVDYDFIEAYNMEIIEGRDFSRNFSTDLAGGGAYIINETAAKSFGWSNPIGKKIGHGNSEKGTVVGVVKDFVSRSMHLPQEPVFLKLTLSGYANRPRFMSVMLNSENVSNTIETIEKIWVKYSDSDFINYYYLDDAYDRLHRSEIKMNKQSNFFALLAIFISCLGLFGLASFTAEQSRKEMGIRKALGASANAIFTLLSWKFFKWIILADLIALPAGYFVMNRWLQDFAYRIDIEAIAFFSAFLIAVVISLVTISIQTLKAAFANPVNSLRYE